MLSNANSARPDRQAQRLIEMNKSKLTAHDDGALFVIGLGLIIFHLNGEAVSNCEKWTSEPIGPRRRGDINISDGASNGLIYLAERNCGSNDW